MAKKDGKKEISRNADTGRFESELKVKATFTQMVRLSVSKKGKVQPRKKEGEKEGPPSSKKDD